jgi:putative hemolysin
MKYISFAIRFLNQTMEIFLLLLILLIISAVFVLSETALITARKTRLEVAAKKGNLGARAALALTSTPNKFLSTTQIGITLVSIIIGAVGGEEYADKIAPYIEQLPYIGHYALPLAKLINVLFIGYLTIAFGEMIPKRIGMSKPEAISQFVAIPMGWVATIMRPFIWLLSSTTDVTMRVLGIKKDESKVTEEEIKAIIDEGANAGTIEEIEQDIVERVFHLGDKKVGTLMTNRSDIIWFDINESMEDNLRKIETHSHAVYPVCEDELDNVKGVVNVKDILTLTLKKQPLNLLDLVKKVNYFPESMSAFGALEKFKESKIHQGLVVDEYGTLVGIVTINDVFDALVGDISQDDSQIAYDLVQREDGSWLVDGQYPWDDFLNEFDIDDDTHTREGFHTISGFLLHRLEALPQTGEVVKWNDFSFEVVDMDGMRIDKILVYKK